MSVPRQLRQVLLVTVILSGPAIFFGSSMRSLSVTAVNPCSSAPYRDTPWDFTGRKLKLTLDERFLGDGWTEAAAGRDANEFMALTADQQQIRLHSASWPLQPEPGAELYLYSADEVVERVMDFSASGRKVAELLQDELRRDLYRAQWIAKKSAFDWDRPWEDGKLVPLAYKDDEAAARQLAIWRVVDGLSTGTYQGQVTREIVRRSEELLELSAYNAPEQGYLDHDQGAATLGASSIRWHGKVVIGATVGTSDGTKLRLQPLTFDYPGGRVLALTDDSGSVCVSLPETIGSPPTVAVRWERFIEAGSYFVALSEGSRPAAAGWDMDQRRALPDRRFVAITLNPFRVSDQLTISLPPRE